MPTQRRSIGASRATASVVGYRLTAGRAADRWAAAGATGWECCVRSSDRSAAIRGSAVAALAVLTLGGCAMLFPSPPPPTYDLTAPQQFSRRAGSAHGVLVVPPPSGLSSLDSQRIVVRSAGEQIAYLPDAQWSTKLGDLIQARTIQAFENAGRLRGIGRPSDRLTPDSQLLMDIRTFEIDASTPQPQAVVEIAAKISGDQSGKVSAARIFSARVPIEKLDGPTATLGLDQAMGRVLTELVLWAGR
jgi:cholesterol transport system auxiliary component